MNSFTFINSSLGFVSLVLCTCLLVISARLVMVSLPGVSVGFSFALAMTLTVPCHSELPIDMAL